MGVVVAEDEDDVNDLAAEWLVDVEGLWADLLKKDPCVTDEVLVVVLPPLLPTILFVSSVLRGITYDEGKSAPLSLSLQTLFVLPALL